MAFWLLKTEPGTYSWDDLVREKKATWDGVSNAAALINLRAMKKGDLALIYHTGTQRAAVGIAEITRGAYPDPKQDNATLAVVDIKPKLKLARPVTLDEIKSDKTFAGFDLLRIGRLSGVAVPKKMWDRIKKLADSEAA